VDLATGRYQGINHQHLTEMLTEYERLAISRLGLSISRESAERYGGSLDLVRSELGKGSTFVLRLPAASW
jgi:signal transduction histidine kinase